MADDQARKLADKGPTLLERSHTSADIHLHCASEHFCKTASPSARPLVACSSSTCIRSSSIFGMRPTPNAQSTDALRTHARRDKFAAQPCGFWTPPLRQAVVPFQKLVTSPWESVCVRHPPGKYEPHTRKI
jgi:hypothetical protein